jgi:hypothetical protein
MEVNVGLGEDGGSSSGSCRNVDMEKGVKIIWM